MSFAMCCFFLALHCEHGYFRRALHWNLQKPGPWGESLRGVCVGNKTRSSTYQYYGVTEACMFASSLTSQAQSFPAYIHLYFKSNK